MGRNPPAVPADTAPDVWRRQMDAIAARPMAERLREWAELNRAVAEMELASIRRRHPDYTESEVMRAAVRHRHGDDLARAAWRDEPLLPW
jgi:hypothetical protein